MAIIEDHPLIKGIMNGNTLLFCSTRIKNSRVVVFQVVDIIITMGGFYIKAQPRVSECTRNLSADRFAIPMADKNTQTFRYYM